ncbi:MAG: methyltransferase domain-containing protein [Pseudomonadota bacterium]
MLSTNSPLGQDRICIHCLHPDLHVLSDTEIVCRSCNKEYPIIEGVPVLVDDFSEHQKYLVDSMAGREDWYESEQVVPPEQNSWLHTNRMMAALLADLYKKHVGPGKEILDLGCGDGRNREFLKTVGGRIVGTDYNLLRVARASNGADQYDSLFMSNLLSLPLPDRSCQVIHFDQVLEHIPAPEKALASIHRVLRDDGVLMLGIPNEGCWYHQLKFKIKPSLLNKTDHVNFFTSKSITALLADCGFDVIETRRIGWGLPVMGNGPLLGSITKLDSAFRRHVWYNKTWELCGRTLLPNQNFLLYIVAKKIRMH